MKTPAALNKVPTPFRRPPVILAIVITLLALGFLIFRPARNGALPTDFFTVKRGDFTVTVVEGGTLNPVSEVIIRSEVEGTARIISIVPEGSFVKKGELLVELDSGQAQDQVNQQQISYEKARFALDQAAAQLDIQRSTTNSEFLAADLKVQFAKIDLDKYLRGQRMVDFIKASNSVLEAEASYKVREETYRNTVNLNKKGYEPKQRVDSDELAALTSRNATIMATNSLWILMHFEDEKQKRRLEADVYQAEQELDRVISQNLRRMAQAQADLIAQSNTLALSEQKLERDRRNLKATRIEAPQDGLVVYQMGQGPFSSESMIEGGAVVRNRQELIKLPDLSRMKVTIKVHESNVGFVKPGLTAYITLDSQADQRFQGYVERVAPLPDTQARWGNPNLKVYTTEIFLAGTLPNAKPGVSAKAEVVVTNLSDTLSVPIQAVTTLRGKQVVYVQKGGKAVPQPVEVGLFNTKFIQIKNGLQEGDRVLLSPPFDTEERGLDGGVLSDEEKAAAATNAPARPALTNREPEFTREEGSPPRTLGNAEAAAFAAAPGAMGTPGSDTPAGARGSQPGGFNREEFMKQFDKNGDGQIDETEREAVQTAMAARFGAGGGPGGGQSREERMKRFDLNKDGQIDEEERAAMRASFGGAQRGAGDGAPGGQGGQGGQGGRRSPRGEGTGPGGGGGSPDASGAPASSP